MNPEPGTAREVLVAARDTSVDGPLPTPAVILLLQQQAEAFVRAAKAPSTLRAYRSDWTHFTRWCEEHTLCPLPASAETIALYLAALAATHRPATMTRRLTAITKAHQIAGHPSPATMQQPAVSETLKGIRRTLGTAQQTKAPLLTADVRRMVEALRENLAGRRDRALLLLGFAGGFRRSELAALNCEDVQPTEDGLVVKLRRSKTDPEGKGRDVGIPYGSTPSTCPVRALTAWQTAAGIAEGAYFGGSIAMGASVPSACTKIPWAWLSNEPPRRPASIPPSMPAIPCAPASPPRPT
jgi:site-specific recombinase XerC